ncbi:MAG TPA: hypothetical protein VMZ29_10390 [Candidatus Bathyarchaeia archaeon]|nr:hypothetical protein [Candidatus Bathyarchaeia archaeon]
MAKKKVIFIIFLSMTFLLITVQAYSTSSSCTEQATTNRNIKEVFKSNFNINQDSLTTNAINFTLTEQVEPVWFYVNLVVIILTPIAIIVPTVIINNRKTKGFQYPNSTESPKILTDDELGIEEPKILSGENSETKSGIILTRIGLLMFFVQNLAILIMYILFFVLIPTYSDPQTPVTVIQIYLILFELDFIAGILIAIGLIILSLNVNKSKIFAYIAAGAWLAFIGLAIYPRIEMIISFTGDLSSTEGIMAYLEQLFEYLVTFYGVDVFLQTCGHCFLVIALFYTSKFLHDNTQFTAKGIVNSFGIFNYIAGSLMNILLLSILTFGFNFTPEALGSIAILYVITLTIKLIAVPFVGLIAGIMGFKRMKLVEAKA